MLSDIFPTGWHATRLAELKPGESIPIYGAGTRRSTWRPCPRAFRAPAKFSSVDGEADRLALAKQIGAITIRNERWQDQ